LVLQEVLTGVRAGSSWAVGAVLIVEGLVNGTSTDSTTLGRKLMTASAPRGQILAAVTISSLLAFATYLSFWWLQSRYERKHFGRLQSNHTMYPLQSGGLMKRILKLISKPVSVGAIAPLVLGAAVLLVSGCKSKARPSILQREWTANAEFAGDVWAEGVPTSSGQTLEVREGSELNDPIKQVRSGNADFGVASADRVLRENEGGADLVVIATSTYRTPVVFISRPDAKLEKPEDLKHRSVGIQTGTNTELVLRELLKIRNIPPADLKIVESGWGTASYEAKTIDVLAGFDYDEPVQLSRKGLHYAVMHPETYGVQSVGTVYFTRRALVNSDPTKVQNFMDALVVGWRNALAQPKTAVDKLKLQFHDVDADKETESLTRGAPYFAGEDDHLLYASPVRWNRMAEDLIALNVIRHFKFEENVDYRFLESALHKGQG
jgi:NitT/TauT family transport system substrate-binding protein